MKKILIYLLPLVFYSSAFSQIIKFEQIAPLPPNPTIVTNFWGASNGSIDFADIDGDNDRDAIITG